MATLYTRKNEKGEKVFYANYVVDGRRIRKSLGRNKRLAELALKDIEVKIEKHELGFGGLKEISLKELAKRYLEYVKASWSWKTYNSTYRPKIVAFLGFIGDKKLSQVTTKDIEDYKLHRLKEVSQSTVAGDITALKAMFNWSIGQEYLRDNPCKKVKKLKKTPQNPPRFLSKEEIDKLLETAKGHYLYPLIATALYAGLRESELIWLEWQDIDFERDTITVLNKEGFHTKSYKSRTIPLNEKLQRTLLPYRKKSGWCFLNSEGGQFRNNLLKRFKAICKKAGVENCHLHTLRHTFASQLVMAGVSIYKVSQWLGHSDVKTTMIYAHLGPQDADINRI